MQAVIVKITKYILFLLSFCLISGVIVSGKYQYISDYPNHQCEVLNVESEYFGCNDFSSYDKNGFCRHSRHTVTCKIGKTTEIITEGNMLSTLLLKIKYGNKEVTVHKADSPDYDLIGTGYFEAPYFYYQVYQFSWFEMRPTFNNWRRININTGLIEKLWMKPSTLLGN